MLFLTRLHDIFSRNSGFFMKGKLKSNIVRIAQKMDECQGNPFRITDMIRATIVVQKPEDIVLAYQMIQRKNYFNIIKI